MIEVTIDVVRDKNISWFEKECILNTRREWLKIERANDRKELCRLRSRINKFKYRNRISKIINYNFILPIYKCKRKISRNF